ncbi:hypothetical protein [Nocardia sienata]|uniref:hypothetical protein n=1 Tax=Nocardia sienata TaxID=248552 RepID=UPI0009FBE662|nr:hypothetical protein [Nocardia sienata]
MAEQLTPARWTQRIVDRLLPVAVSRAAAPNGIRFTERQLYYELCRLLAPVPRLPRRIAFTVPAPLSLATFHAALARHREIPGLLTPAPPRTAPPGAHTPEPDLFDYGLPRLLICESHTVAHMLRANGLPMESATPVLSAAELPLHPGVTAMLARGAGEVYVLHEASAAGLAFPARPSELTGIPAGLRVVPLGLRPRQVLGLHLFHIDGPAVDSGQLPDGPSAPDAPGPAFGGRGSRRRGPGVIAPPEVTGGEPPARLLADYHQGDGPGPGFLDEREQAWLRRGRIVELEAVHPAVLLRSVHRLVRGVRTPPPPLAELRRARRSGFLTWPAA